MSSQKQVNICHVITGLNQGGAEKMLCNLLAHTNKDQYAPLVVSLLPIGVNGPVIRAMGIEVITLNMRQGQIAPGKILELSKIIKDKKIHLLHGWMYHANLLTSLSSFSSKKTHIWSIHHTNLEKNTNKGSTLKVVKLSALLSKHCPNAIVYCAEQSRLSHEHIGYDKTKAVTIPTGYDTNEFRYDALLRNAIRRELKIADSASVIGLVARFDPQKDHKTFFKAVTAVLREQSSEKETHFVLCGSGISESNPELIRLIPNWPTVQDRIHLLGERSDMQALYSAFDILALTSVGEVLPNVIGEAMACGVPCVVTNVGNCAELVGETGIVVPPQSPELFAQALLDMIDSLKKTKEQLAKAARERIMKYHDIRVTGKKYEALYDKIIHRANTKSNLNK